ncbi:hypothetical protein XELAEV_18044018mg [Xenopus laevis]|uniref:Uncharacterized protein n=1 Tax=Xenopus laevis TaxID=8355 RepID=A0A974BYN3_XENLA|nr:hypothetical protein XELAEV_18044018mg [Xenopus laevis]
MMLMVQIMSGPDTFTSPNLALFAKSLDTPVVKHHSPRFLASSSYSSMLLIASFPKILSKPISLQQLHSLYYGIISQDP